MSDFEGATDPVWLSPSPAFPFGVCPPYLHAGPPGPESVRAAICAGRPVALWAADAWAGRPAYAGASALRNHCWASDCFLRIHIFWSSSALHFAFPLGQLKPQVAEAQVSSTVPLWAPHTFGSHPLTKVRNLFWYREGIICELDGCKKRASAKCYLQGQKGWREYLFTCTCRMYLKRYTRNRWCWLPAHREEHGGTERGDF